MEEIVKIESGLKQPKARAKKAQPIEKGAPLSLGMIDEYLTHLSDKGCVEGTLELYRRGLTRLYDSLPKQDKSIHRTTLKEWREKLLSEGYASSTVNSHIVVANGYLEYMGRREFQLVGQLEQSDDLCPELSRTEYLRLLQTAKILGKERTYLLIKLFGNSDRPVQELPKLTVEAVKAGKVNTVNIGIKQVIRLPECLCAELLSYANRSGIGSGPIFLTRKGEVMTRSNVSTGIRQLSLAAKVPEEKANPRCLRKLYLSTREGIERNIALLVEQAQERMLEEEQLSIGWDND